MLYFEGSKIFNSFNDSRFKFKVSNTQCFDNPKVVGYFYGIVAKNWEAIVDSVSRTKKT